MAKKRQKPADDGGGDFMTTYADMVTLLMAFFVMLFAISSVDQVKFLSLLKGLQDSFGNSSYQEQILRGGASIIGANQPAGSSIPVAGGAIVLVPSAPVEELQQLEERAMELLEAENVPVGLARVDVVDGIEDALDNANATLELPEIANILDLTELREVQLQLMEAAAAVGLEDAVTSELRARGLVVILSVDDILFRSGSAVLEPGLGREFIGTIAQVLGEIDNPIQIEGHTDDVPLDRAGYSNWNLAADRAIAVLNLFVEEHDLPADRLQVGAYADQQPRVPNDSDENRSKNRRVEIVIGIDEADSALVVVGDDALTG